MDPSRWKTLRAALEELVEVPASARTAVLDRIAGDDEELRAELLRLLPTWDKAPDLESPRARAAPPTDLGRRIGPWILERELGVGGMGHVFLARRAEGGFDQRVALKLIRRGLDTDKVLRRFERERAMLARLAHLSIAQLHDGGATSEGLPWFAMEYVEGAPIDRWCAEHELSARERVELFLKVAAAVQHAHAHLIVHRDIKPSNILVGADGVPKLLDFGIAKALEEGDDTEPTLTQTGERVLTPLYASPEQWHGEPATIASDIYALGVVLYELLAGLPPRSREELVRLEREPDWPAPERPSTRAMRGSDTTSTGVDTRALARETKGDLDLIVLKALHTDPARRYSSVESFAADLRRWLEGRPVEARADSLGYRTRRYVRRNRVAVGAAAVVFVGLTVGLFVAIDGWNDAVDANTKATAAQARAQAETSKLLQLAARQDLQDLNAEAETLWPLEPALLPRLDAWIEKAGQLVADAAKHRATLSDLDSGTVDAVRLDEKEKIWWRRQLVGHLEDLEAFVDPARGLFTDSSNAAGVGIVRRAKLIRLAQSLEVPGSVADRAWEEAREYLRSRPDYKDLKLTPIFGLMPIGPDPASGLLEFASVLTGNVPRRDDHGSLVLGPYSAVIFVLVPKSTAATGAQVVDPAGENYDPLADRTTESPIWHVELDPFLISKFELTQVQWLRMEGTNPSWHKSMTADSSPGFDMMPVEMISWDDCRRVLDRYGLVLPTSIQWELAARAGTNGAWWCGTDAQCLAACENLFDLDGQEVLKMSRPNEPWHDGSAWTSRVNKYPPNPFGLHDVIGNVSEWCLEISCQMKVQPARGRGIRDCVMNLRSIRGGSFRSTADKARVSYRITAPPGSAADTVGVRPAILLVEDGPRWGPEPRTKP